MPLGRVIVTAAKAAVKYGPAAKVVYDQAKEPATDYARRKLEAARSRRLAIEKARTLRDGMLLRVMPQDEPVWVVFSGDEPISAHPDTGAPLADLLLRADLTRRVYPDQIPSTRDRAVAVRDTAIGSVRRRKGPRDKGPPDKSPQDRIG